MAPVQLGDPTLPAALGILDILTHLGSPDRGAPLAEQPVGAGAPGPTHPLRRKQAVAALLGSARQGPAAGRRGGRAPGTGAPAARRSPVCARWLSAAGNGPRPDGTDRPEPGASALQPAAGFLVPTWILTAHVTAREALALWLGPEEEQQMTATAPHASVPHGVGNRVPGGRPAESCKSPEEVAGVRPRRSSPRCRPELPLPGWQPASLLSGHPGIARWCTPDVPGPTPGTRPSGTPISRRPSRRPTDAGPAAWRELAAARAAARERTRRLPPACWHAPPEVHAA